MSEIGLDKISTKTPSVITTPEEYTTALRRWEQHYNVLTPFSNVSGIAPSFGIIATVVKINTNQIDGEVYSGTTPAGRAGMPFLKGAPGTPLEELALAKIGLRKLAECGGISTSTQRTDPRTIANYWEFKAIATYRGLDGTNVVREATFEWDLRDGSDRLKGWTAQQVSEGRKNGLRNCEARAINAAIRECGCGIKQKYTRAELEKPFVVVRVAFHPDMSDPAIKQMVTQQALHGASALYPARALEASSTVLDSELPETTEPRSVGRSSTAASAKPRPTDHATPDATRPPVEGAVQIVKIETKTGTSPNGRKWTRYIVIDSQGVEHSTFSASIATFAEQAIDTKQWVEINEEQDGPYRNLVGITPAGQHPSLPGIGDL